MEPLAVISKRKHMWPSGECFLTTEKVRWIPISVQLVAETRDGDPKTDPSFPLYVVFYDAVKKANFRKIFLMERNRRNVERNRQNSTDNSLWISM
jgi:hypothetical protein